MHCCIGGYLLNTAEKHGGDGSCLCGSPRIMVLLRAGRRRQIIRFFVFPIGGSRYDFRTAVGTEFPVGIDRILALLAIIVREIEAAMRAVRPAPVQLALALGAGVRFQRVRPRDEIDQYRVDDDD
jgi:hypothetical protein